MNDYPSHQLQRETYLEWGKYLNRFPWQWLCHLTFKDGIKFFPASNYFKRWRLSLIDNEKLRVGAYRISAYKQGHIHFHVLMIGRNREGKTLNDCSRRRWEAAWPFFAKIRRVDSNWEACDYVAKNFLGFKSDHTEVDSYDQTLLSQELRPQLDGLDNLDGLRRRENDHPVF